LAFETATNSGISPQIAAVEVSSYQLEAQGHLAVAAACILNISVDHLERHNSLENYARTKAKLMECMKPGSVGAIISQDVIDLCGSTKALQGCARIGSLPGVMLRRAEAQVMHRDWKRARSLDLSALQCPGQHNMLNAAVRTSFQKWSFHRSKSLSLCGWLWNTSCTYVQQSS
jgi:UDP-N-acetylmuramoylalanine-D-glutamate ligase